MSAYRLTFIIIIVSLSISSDSDEYFQSALYIILIYSFSFTITCRRSNNLEHHLFSCPGLTHPAAAMEDVAAETPVQIVAEGKDNACAIGLTAMSSKDITVKNTGTGVTSLHYLNDGLWQNKELN